jgi:PAS domain S-box-containing protein
MNQVIKTKINEKRVKKIKTGSNDKKVLTPLSPKKGTGTAKEIMGGGKHPARKDIEANLGKSRKELAVIKKTADETSEFAENVINTVREPLIALDQDLRVVKVSRSFYDFFKVKPEETVGRLIYNLGNKQWDIPKLRELLETILPQKASFDNYEVEHEFATIGRRVMLLNARQIQRAAGKEQIILLAIEDITERKQAESQREAALEALRNSEENFRRSLEDSPLGVRIVTANGETIYANKMLLDIYGYANVEELNQTPLKERYTPQSYAEFKIRKKAREDGDPGPSEYDIAIVRKNKEIRHLQVLRKEVFWNGTRQFQVIYQDITERYLAEYQSEAMLAALRESEEKFRKIFEDHSAVKLLIEPESGAIIDANKAAEKYYGWTRAELKRMHIQQINILPAEQMKLELKKAQQRKCVHFEFRHRRADGSIRDVEVFSSGIEMAGKDILHSIIQDITERKQVEEALCQSEARFRRLAENARDMIYRMSLPDGKYEYISPAALSVFGYSPEEFYKTPKLIKQAIHPDWQKYFEEQWANLIKGEMPPIYEYQIIHKSGEIRWLNQRNILVRDNAENPIAIEGIITDITERKRAEVVLRISEGRYRVAEAIGHLGNWEYNLQTTKFWGSDEAKRIYGFDSEALDFSTDEVEKCIPERERVHQALVDLIEADKPYNLEFEIHPKNSLKPRIISSVAELKRDEHGNPLLVTGVIQDITTRKRAEEDLQFRNVLLATQQEVSIDGILVVDENAHILSYNRRFVEMMGLPPKLVEDRVDEPVLQFVTAQMADPQSFLQRIQYLYEHRQETSRDELVLADGRFFDRYSAPLIGSGKQYFGRVWYFRDITERKRAEMEIARVNRTLQMLSDSNQALIHIADEAALLNEVCRIAVDVGGYRMAWVGFAEQDEAKTLRPVAHAGFESGYIESAKVSWGDSERGRGPGGMAIRTGHSCIARNIPLDPTFVPWREAAIQRGYKSIIALPLKSEGRTLGALGIYSGEPDAFDVKEVEILEELANDLAFGVTALRMKAKHDQAEEALKKSEAQLNEAQRMAHIGSWELDIVDNVLIWSDEIYRIFEIDPKKFGATYEVFLNAIHPDDREAVNLAYTNSLKTRISYSIDHRLLFPDGRVKYVHEQCKTYYDADDKPLRSLGTVQDITERKHAEESQLRSEEENRAIISAVPDILFKIDSMGTILDYHSQTESKLYAQPEVFIGKKIEEVLPTHVSMPAKEAIIRTLESDSQSQFEYELDMPNGRQSFECRIVPLAGEQVLAVVRDITERKQTEKKVSQLAAIVESSEDAIIGKNLDGIILSWNKGAEKIYGYSESEVIGKPISIVIPPERADEVLQILKKIKLGEYIEHYEAMRRKKDGQDIHMSLSISPIRDTEGRVVAASTIGRDISERKRTEEALEKRLVALTRPLDVSMGIEFEELFNLNDIQRLQDEFAKATGVASIITHPDGTPITEPSNFCRLCKDIIRKTDKGRAYCYKSDSVLGHFSAQGPSIQPCMSGGLWDAGAGISAGGHHIANWLIGQVRDETQSEDKMRKFAREIGADESDFIEAFHEVTAMPQEQFQRIAQALFTLANQLSAISYQNIQQARFITEHKRVENIAKARLRLLEFANSHSMDELLTATLDEIEALTGSTIGFYHFVESDQKTLSLQNWSTNTLKNMCTATGKGSHYDVAQAGVWADCVHQRRPVIHNDYISLTHRKGTPEGHAPVVREVVIPIFRGNLIKAIIGVGNKSSDYNEDDIEVVSQVGDFSWDITVHKLAEEKIRNSLVEKEVLLKELYHRVKNNLMIIIGLIKMQEAKVDNEIVDPLLHELEGRIRSLALVHEGLYISADLAHVDLQNYIETMGAQISAQFGADRNIRFLVQAIGVEVGLDVAVPCGLILNELITNAHKHAFPENKPHSGAGNCEIAVIVKRENGACILTVADNGVGLPEGFDWEKSETLGLRLIKMLSQQINGSLELDRSVGTAFHLKFPVA